MGVKSFGHIKGLIELSNIIGLFLTFSRFNTRISRIVGPVFNPTTVSEGCLFPTSSPVFVVSCLVDLCYADLGKINSQNCFDFFIRYDEHF